MPKTLTPAELALELNTDAKTCRRFLRSSQGLDTKVGKGHRWAIEAKQVRGLKSRFTKWAAADAEAKANRAAAKATEAKALAAEAPDENEVLEIEGPTDDDLLALEAGDEMIDLED